MLGAKTSFNMHSVRKNLFRIIKLYSETFLGHVLLLHLNLLRTQEFDKET